MTASEYLFGSSGRIAARSATGFIWAPGRNKKIELTKKLYVGNLPFTTTEDELRDLFEQHGKTESVAVITDRETGRARGFAFVEMEDEASAEKAMRALDGNDMGGRTLRVNEANDRGRGGRPGGGGGGGRPRY